MSWEVKYISYQELEAEIAKQGPDISFPDFYGCLRLEMDKLPDGIQSLAVCGRVLADKLKELPDNFSIWVHQGELSLHGVETVGNNVTLFADGNVAIGKWVMSSARTRFNYLAQYPHITMGDNVTIFAGCHLLMPCLEKLGKNATFNCIHNIDMNGLSVMGSNAKITSRWHDIELYRLENMGENCTLSAEFILMPKISSDECSATINAKRGVGYKDKPLLDGVSRQPLW